MKKDKQILIAGAGPSGLSAALFLTELGYRPRIIDKKTTISPYSKALGVNPRTLELFESLGITKQFLQNGRKMTAINIWKGNQHIFKNDFSKVKHKYPFMLVQPQQESEGILRSALQQRGIEVEYGVGLSGFQYQNSIYQVNLSDNTVSNYNYLIGADGGHSVVRKQLGINYKGYRYDEIWELYDIELDTVIEPNEGHIRVFPEGGMIMIRLKDNIWRIAGNMKDILNYLPSKTQTGTIHWESKFRIHHKVAESLVQGQAVLIGDAAHLHSPVGARGMNLGIEDAYLVSQLLAKDELQHFTQLRRPYLAATVNRINNMTTGFAGNTLPSRFFRKNINWISVIFPLVMPTARKFIMGLNR